MRATAPGARMMSSIKQARPTVTLSLRDLVFRSHIGVGTGQRPAAERRAAYERLLDLARRGEIVIDITRFKLDDAQAAWQAPRSEEQKSELQSQMRTTYAVFSMKKKTQHTT